MEHFCRLCADIKLDMVPIFNGNEDETSISYRIHTNLHIPITAEDLLPVAVCHSCLETLDKFCKYVSNCQSAQKRLQTLLATAEGSRPVEFSKLDVSCGQDDQISSTRPLFVRIPNKLPSDSCKASAIDEEAGDVENNDSILSQTQSISSADVIEIKKEEVQVTLPNILIVDTASVEKCEVGFEQQPSTSTSGDLLKSSLGDHNLSTKTCDSNKKNASSQDYNFENIIRDEKNYDVNSTTVSRVPNHLEELLRPHYANCDTSAPECYCDESNSKYPAKIEGFATDQLVADEGVNAMVKTSTCNSESACIEPKILPQPEREVDQSPKVFVCRKCDGKFGKKNLLACHIRKQHSRVAKVNLPSSKKKKNSTKQKYSGEHGRSMSDVHLKGVHEQSISRSCTLCSYKTPSKFMLKHHVREVHEKPFECDICVPRLAKEFQLVVHMLKPLCDGAPIKCFLCNETFSHKSHLVQHFKVHRANGRRFLTASKEECDQKYKLLPHNSKKHKIVDVKCNQHKRQVHEKHFTCHTCGKKTSKRSRLLLHMHKKHSEKKAYTFKNCSTRFISK